MTTRAQFVTAVRAELQDPGPSYVWSDGLLQGFLGDAINQLSIDLPPVKETTLVGVFGQRDYAIAVATLLIGPGGIQRVEYPAGVLILPGDTAPRYESGGLSGYEYYDQRWELIRSAGDVQTLRFRYPLTNSGTIYVKAWSVYATPAADADVLQVSVFDEVALKWYVCYRALAWLDEVRGKRSQANVPGIRGTQGYYLRLYNAAIVARKRAAGVMSGSVVL